MMIDPFPGILSRSNSLGTPYVLTDDQAGWLRRFFPVESTEEIARMMGMHRSSVTRIARRLGIAKDREAYLRRLRDIQLRIVESERRRERWGLPRRTGYHLPTRAYTKKEISRRWNAKRKWGYIPGDKVEERYVIFYDGNTRRNKSFEHYCEKNGFTIKELKRDC